MSAPDKLNKRQAPAHGGALASVALLVIGLLVPVAPPPSQASLNTPSSSSASAMVDDQAHANDDGAPRHPGLQQRERTEGLAAPRIAPEKAAVHLAPAPSVAAAWVRPPSTATSSASASSHQWPLVAPARARVLAWRDLAVPARAGPARA